MSEKSLTHGIKFKDKIGYAMGDMGGLLTFSLIGAFQNKFYTDVLHIQPAKIVVLILVARLWDAINDPIWGAFIDSRKPTKQGKFRPYVFWFSIPLAVSAVLMFTVIPNLSEAKYLLFAYITYILYGMMYTCVNIPYGSLASVVTDDEKERSSLSMWRSIGAGLCGQLGHRAVQLIHNTQLVHSLSCLDFSNTTCIAPQQVGVLAATIGADAPLGHSIIGLAAGVAQGDGMHRLNLQPGASQHFRSIRRPAPAVHQIGVLNSGHLTHIQRNAAHLRYPVLAPHLLHSINNMEYDAQLVHTYSLLKRILISRFSI